MFDLALWNYEWSLGVRCRSMLLRVLFMDLLRIILMGIGVFFGAPNAPV